MKTSYIIQPTNTKRITIKTGPELKPFFYSQIKRKKKDISAAKSTRSGQ